MIINLNLLLALLLLLLFSLLASFFSHLSALSSRDLYFDLNFRLR